MWQGNSLPFSINALDASLPFSINALDASSPPPECDAGPAEVVPATAGVGSLDQHIVFSADLTTLTAMVCLMSRTARRSSGGCSPYAYGFGGDELDGAASPVLTNFGLAYQFSDRSELASNVGGVAIEEGYVAGADLTRVAEDDNLSVEGSGFLGGVVLGVRRDVPSADILDGHVLDVEADVVTGVTSLELLMMHFDELEFRGTVPTPPILHTGYARGDGGPQ
jgi:hypothetical protein